MSDIVSAELLLLRRGSSSGDAMVGSGDGVCVCVCETRTGIGVEDGGAWRVLWIEKFGVQSSKERITWERSAVNDHSQGGLLYPALPFGAGPERLLAAHERYVPSLQKGGVVAWGLCWGSPGRPAVTLLHPSRRRVGRHATCK